MVVGAAADEAPSIRNRLRGWTHREEPEEAMLLPDDIDPEELRYAPREPKRYRWVVRTIIALVVAALLIGGGAWAYGWTQDQYYVSSDGEQVAIYQGIQADLPGVDLHHVYADAGPHPRRAAVVRAQSGDRGPVRREPRRRPRDRRPAPVLRQRVLGADRFLEQHERRHHEEHRQDDRRLDQG